MTLIAAVILGLLAPTMSWAACETTYTNNAMAEDIVAVRSLFDEGELSDAKRRLLEMGEGATCLDKLAEPGLIARFGQLMALSFFFAQDEDQAERWALLAYYTGPNIPYELNETHPFMELVSDLPDRPFGQKQGKQLAPPERGAIFLNGHLALQPIARAEVPYLVQVFDGNGRLLGGFWQDGAQFQDGLLADGVGRPSKPRWYRGPVMDYDENGVSASTGTTMSSSASGSRSNQESFLVPAVVSGSLAATSLAALVGAAMAHSSLPRQTTSEGLTKARTTANALVVVSGTTFAGAVGVGATILIDGSTVGVRIRF